MMRLLAILFGLAQAMSGASASEFAVAPLRQVISSERPVAEFRVSNPTDRSLEIRLSWVDLAAAPEGYVAATPKQRALLSAAPYLILKPVHARIEPGGATLVTVALKPGAKPPAGERRSHLLIETGAARMPIRKTSGLELDIGLGVTTPVILRGGKGSASAKIGASRFLRTPEGDLLLETVLEPQGVFSAYGRLTAEFSDGGAQSRQLGEVRNVNAFADAKRRLYTIPLKTRELPAGTLRVKFIGAEEFEGEVFASRDFNVGAPRQ